MKVIRLLILLLLILSFVPNTVEGQRWNKYKRKLEEYRQESWPPPRSYSKVSLGYALQKKFKQHTEFCGFAINGNNRDYVPKDISRFLGKRTLRTKVETADIRGGGLLYYIFNQQDLKVPFDHLNFTPTRVMNLESINDQFVVNPNGNFDSFILTKNCSGYLKSALDAGIEPPYVAFQNALETDSKRESTVMAISGSFVSPLKLVLDANNSQTAEALIQLWKFYNDNPQYINQAYYLREFEGVMIKHISSAEENRKIESKVGININFPLAARIKADLELGSGKVNSFMGTDWETMVYSDFESNYEREQLFSPLPSPIEIASYFSGIDPIYQKARDFPLMSEGVEHQHYLVVKGIPENMTQNFWEIEAVKPGVYEGIPQLRAEYFEEEDGTFGCRFTISGRPHDRNFAGPLTARPSKLDVAYTIKSREAVDGIFIKFYIQQEIQTSSHPIATATRGEFDLKSREDRRFAFQWEFEIDIVDRDNPIDFDVQPIINNIIARNSDQELNLLLTEIRPDPSRRKFYVTLETKDTYPLDRIDDANMINYNLKMDVHLQGLRSFGKSIRPVKGVLSFPAIKKMAPETLQELIKPNIIPPVRPLGNK